MAVSLKSKNANLGCPCCATTTPAQRRRIVRVVTKRETRREIIAGMLAYQARDEE